MEIAIYSQQAEKVGTTDLPDGVFGLKWNPALVWQVAESERANLRQGSAHTKDRSEVRGGGKKPWRQKGTGRARHGSIRSPIWVGGGITHGPRNEKIYAKKINKKMRQRALAVVLSQKLRDKEVLLLDSLNLPTGKTKAAYVAIKALSQIKEYDGIGIKSKAIAALGGSDQKSARALRNLPKVSVIEARNINLLDTLNSRHLIFSKDSMDILSLRFKKSRNLNDPETWQSNNPKT